MFFLIVGHYHFFGAYAGATACLRGHSGSLRLAYVHIILYMCLRPPTPPREMPTSTMINVNLLINPFVYKKNLCSSDEGLWSEFTMETCDIHNQDSSHQPQRLNKPLWKTLMAYEGLEKPLRLEVISTRRWARIFQRNQKSWVFLNLQWVYHGFVW